MKNIIFTALCFITVLQCSGNVLELRMPEDLDFSRNLFFIRGKAYPVKFDRNRVWIKRGKTAAFTGNTLDIHFTGHGEKSIALELDGKPFSAPTGSKWRGMVRMNVPNGTHKLHVPQKGIAFSVCAKEVYEVPRTLISRPVILPAGAAGIRASIDGGKARVEVKDGRAVIHAEVTGKSAGSLKLHWNGPAGAAAAPRPDTAAGVSCAFVDNMEKIFPEKVYKESKTPLKLYGAPGEKLSFQLAVRGAKADEFASVSGSFPCGSLQAAYQHYSNVAHTRNDHWTNNRIAPLPRRIPDMLTTENGTFLRKNETAAVWLTLHIDRQAKAGTCSGKVQVQTASGKKELPVTVEVMPFRMPQPEEYRCFVLNSAFFIGQIADDCGIKRNTPEFFRLFDEALAMIRSDGQNVLEFSWEFPFFHVRKNKNGQYEFDFSSFDRYYGRVLNFFKDYPHFRLVIPSEYWGVVNNYLSFNNRSIRFPVWKDEKNCVFSEEYKQFFRAFLPAFYNHLDRYSARKKVRFRIFDEPKMHHVRRYKAVKDFLRDTVSDFKVQESVEIAAVYQELNDRLDMAIAHFYSLEKLQHILEKRSASGLETGLYGACTGPAGQWIDMNISGIRIQPYLAYRVGAKKINNFGWYENYGVDMREYPSRNYSNFTSPGDYAKVYPIAEAKTILPSLRTAAMIDVRQDFALLFMLEELNKNAMTKLGITDSDPAEDGRTLCRLLGDFPAVFSTAKENIAGIRKKLYRMIVERSDGIPAVIDGTVKKNSNVVSVRVRSVPGAKITINGKAAADGTARIMLSPENNAVKITVNGKTFTKYFCIRNNQLDELKQLAAKLAQIKRIPAELANYPGKLERSSAGDFEKLLKDFPAVQQKLEEMYIDTLRSRFLRGTVPVELQKAVYRVGELKNKGMRKHAIRLAEMLMKLDPSRLRKKASGAALYPDYQFKRFSWTMKNEHITAVFDADTMRLISLKHKNQEYCARGMVELFDGDSPVGREPADWELLPGEDTPEKVVLRGRRICENIAIERRVTLVKNSGKLEFKTRITAGNLPVWEMQWRTHGFYRGTVLNGKSIAEQPESRIIETAVLSLQNPEQNTVLNLIPHEGIDRIFIWHNKAKLHTIDFAVKRKFTDAIGKTYTVSYALEPLLEGEKSSDVPHPAKREVVIDFSQPLQLPHKLHGTPQFTVEGLKLDRKSAVEFLPSKDFDLHYPFEMTIDFTPGTKGGVLFKRSRSQGEMYYYPSQHYLLILPSRRTMLPQYTRHTIPDKYSGRQQLVISHDGEYLKLYMNGKPVSAPAYYPGTAGAGVPDGLFVGAYGAAGTRPVQFFDGVIHSLKISYGSK